MARNLKMLTKDELDYINNNYSFELVGDYIIAKFNSYNRKILHSINEDFTLNTKARKITITAHAIKLWIEHFKDNYSLIDVQNAINTLIITYQNPSDFEVGNQLNGKNIKNIKEI